MARWSTLQTFAEAYGNRPLARVLGVSESTIREARNPRKDRKSPRQSQLKARATLVERSRGFGPVRLDAALQADREAAPGEKQYRSSVPKRGASRNAPRVVKLPGVLKQAWQVGKEGGHDLYRSQVETLVREMDAQIGPDKPWHIAIHGTYLGQEHGSDGGLIAVTRWISVVTDGRVVLEALAFATMEHDDKVRSLPTFLNKQDEATAKRDITMEFATDFASRLTGLTWLKVDALYIRPAKEFAPEQTPPEQSA